MTSLPRRLDFLDSLRAAAILLVLAFHALSSGFDADSLPWGAWFREAAPQAALNWLAPLTLGWAGVPIFFAVSGFCIHLSHGQSGETGFSGFFLRRGLRIYPPYLTALVFFAILFPLTRLDLTSPAGQGQFGPHALLIHNFADRWFFGINPAFWSIAVETQLYLLYPVLLALINRLGWPCALGLLAVIEGGIGLTGSIWFTATDQQLPGALTDNPLAYWLSWSAGAFVADSMMRGRVNPLARWPAMPWLLLGVGVHFVKPAHRLAFTFIALGTAVWIARRLTRGPEIGSASRGITWLRRVGLWSYSIYLFHQPLLWWAGNKARSLAPPESDEWVAFAGSLAAVLPIILLCALSYRWLETPFAQWGKKLARQLKREQPPNTTR